MGKWMDCLVNDNLTNHDLTDDDLANDGLVNSDLANDDSANDGHRARGTVVAASLAIAVVRSVRTCEVQPVCHAGTSV